jgi:DNA-binding beta-propeller fold protein YncE
VAAAGCQARADDKDSPALKLVQTIPLPGVDGRIDHMAVDAKGRRLYVAALGNDTVEVIDLAAGKPAGTIRGVKKSQGVAYLPDLDRVVVASGGDGACRFYDAATLRPTAEVRGLDDADNVRYDAAAKRVYVGYGEGAGGALAVIDAEKGVKVADVKLAGHPESFRLEEKGPRIFVNVPDAGHVAVVDRDKAAVVATWPVKDAAAFFPLALDEAGHRLLLGCRRPAKLVVLDTEAGKTVATADCAGDADDLFLDAANKRVYVIGGEGAVTVIDRPDADHYAAAGRVRTAAGARTGLFDAAAGRLYVAVPHRGDQAAEVRVFATAPSPL